MLGDKRVIAIIPARGGSKRIPNKNIIPFAGKPMISWTIEAVLGCESIDRVIVSTDSLEIKKVSENCGLSVPFLRSTAFDDHSPVSEATLSSLIQAESEWGSFDIVIQLMPNCPLRGANDIKDSLIFFESHSAESQVSFSRFPGWANPWWAHCVNSDGEPKAIFESKLLHRSQELEELYAPTGSIWISTTKSLKKYKTFYSPDFKLNKVSGLSAIDIDDYEDLEIAEALCLAVKRI